MGGNANPYGRMMKIFGEAGRAAANTGEEFMIGEMLTGAQLKVGDVTLARDDYLLLTNEIEVNGKVMKIPYKKRQEKTVTTPHGGTITVAVPPLKKGDKVLCYQLSDEEFIVFGKVE